MFKDAEYLFFRMPKAPRLTPIWVVQRILMQRWVVCRWRNHRFRSAFFLKSQLRIGLEIKSDSEPLKMNYKEKTIQPNSITS